MILKASVRKANPVMSDPTRTGSIRQGFIAEINRKTNALKRKIWDLVVTEDAFGLKVGGTIKTPSSLVGNQRFAFRTDVEKIKGLSSWFEDQVKEGILSTDAKTGDIWAADYVASAYKQGYQRAYEDLHKSQLSKSVDFYNGSRQEFLRSAFAQPESMEKIRLLASRTFQDLKGVSQDMGTRISRFLVDGMAHGRSPQQIARDMNRAITKLTNTRARTIARTEIINAHAEGQLDSFQKLGVEKLSVMAEWSTAGDDLVCPLCHPLEGVTYTIAEARGILPRHPNCRCAWIPANVGEDPKQGRTILQPKTGQEVWSGPEIRSTSEVQKAMHDSIRAERKKGSYEEVRRRSTWKGADLLKMNKRPVAFVRAVGKGRSSVAMAPAAQLWNHQPTAVIRWMGKEGWSADDAKRVLDEMGVNVKMSTIKTQLGAGKKGLRGPVASLTDEQRALLTAKKLGQKVEVPPKPVLPPVEPTPVPKLPPKIEVPKVDVPKVPVSLPKIEVPKVEVPKVSTTAPSFGDQKATALARWMGKEEWSFAEARKAADELGLDIKDSTLRTQLNAGRKGARGGAPTLTKEQIEYLNSIRGKTPVEKKFIDMSREIDLLKTDEWYQNPSTGKIERTREMVVDLDSMDRNSLLRFAGDELGIETDDMIPYGVDVNDLASIRDYVRKYGKEYAGFKFVKGPGVVAKVLPKIGPPKGITFTGEADDFSRKVWAEMGTGVNTEADAVKIGKLIDDEITRRLDEAFGTLEDAKQLVDDLFREYNIISDQIRMKYPIMSERPLEITAHQREVAKAWTDSSKRYEKIRKDRDRAYGEYAQQTLAKIRDMGFAPGEKLNRVAGSTREATDAINEIMQYIPTDLQRKANKTPILAKADARENPRGYFSVNKGGRSGQSSQNICLRAPRSSEFQRGASVDISESNALHEFTHAVQESNPKVCSLEKEFLRRRVIESKGKNAELTEIYRGSGEMGYKDQFTDHYIGKTYTGLGYGEVMTMGVEGVFYNMHGIQQGDRDLVRFILGVFAGVI